MEINFYFRPLSKSQRTSDDMERPIYMYVSLYGTRQPFNLKIKVLESKWDEDKQRVNLKKDKALAGKINTQLTDWEEKAFDFEEKYKPETAKALIRILEGFEPKQEAIVEDDKEFFRFFRNFTDTSVPEGSKKNYEKCFVHLKSFSNNKYRITWEVLTHKFYKDYLKFMSEEYKNFRTGEKGILNSTLTKDIWTLKHICEIAEDNDIVVPKDVRKFKVPGNSKTKRMKLPEERIKELMKFDFSDWTLYSQHLKVKKILETKIIPNILAVRDIYIFSFYTGLAHKEIMKLTQDHVKKEMLDGKEIFVLDFARTKTRRINSIPLNSICLELIEKYKSRKSLFPFFANQHFNRVCKRMFKTMGFTNKITLTRWSGDREITQVFEEWQLLTSHTGRHSAATNILKKTGDLTIARDLLGHSSIKTTEIYAINDRETFNNKVLKAIEEPEKPKDL